MQEEFPLPSGVRAKHGAWHYVERHQWRKLCRIAEGRERLYIRLQEVTGGVQGMCWHAILSYVARGMNDLAPATRKHYATTSLRMLHHFGHWRLEDLEPTHCAQYLKWCRENQRAVTGNREKALMSSVFEYAMAEGWVSRNPWRGVRRNKERPSRRYVSHAALSEALDRSPPHLQSLLAVAYLTGIRQTDLRFALQTQITGSSLMIDESKTGRRNAHEITKTVRLFLSQAVERSRSFGSEYIFTSARGLPWSEWALQSAMRRFAPGFRFRDLRSKAQSDSEKNILGHTGQMLARYQKRRKLSAVK